MFVAPSAALDDHLTTKPRAFHRAASVNEVDFRGGIGAVIG
jgi:hypothetical protein